MAPSSSFEVKFHNKQTTTTTASTRSTRAELTETSNQGERAEAVKSALCYVSPSAYDALMSELAHTHNYTHFLNWSFEETEPVELTTITNPTANVPNAENTAKTREGSCSTQRPTEQCRVCHTSSTRARSLPSPKVLSFEERKQLETQYHKDQAEVELFLYNFRNNFDEPSGFERMFFILYHMH
ncbi:hypothetical protein Q7P36_009633 [Cladosporium allicinum]